jgi:hypothetical protein
VDTRTAVAALKVLWEHATRIRPGDDKRTALDLAVAALTDVFTQAPTPTRPSTRTLTVGQTGTRLTLADMAARTR